MAKFAWIHHLGVVGPSVCLSVCRSLVDQSCSSRAWLPSISQPKFLQGYVAKDLGCSVLEESYYFGLANERMSGNLSEKLRVIIARRELLENYEAHVAAAEILNERTGRVRYEQGVHVRLAMPYFKQRWEQTIRNMADLFHHPKSKSLREIEFSVAASRVALEQVDAKLAAMAEASSPGAAGW